MRGRRVGGKVHDGVRHVCGVVLVRGLRVGLGGRGVVHGARVVVRDRLVRARVRVRVGGVLVVLLLLLLLLRGGGGGGLLHVVVVPHFVVVLRHACAVFEPELYTNVSG